MRLVLLGPPGSGKGTQAEWLCERFGLTGIGTGKLLRDAIRNGSAAVEGYREQYARGVLAPDGMVNELVAEFFHTARPEKFLLDGYPRTYPQAIAFDALLRQEYLKLDAVFHLALPDAEAVRRIGGRRICENGGCAAIYHLAANPPTNDGICDQCGSGLVLRKDDTESGIRQRLAEYHANAGPLLDHYRTAGLLRELAAMQPPEDVRAAILRHLTQ
jgi:adenylate kinase